jgi:hypothetical protein
VRDVKRVRAPLQQSLQVRATDSLRLQANGGLKVDAKSVHIQAQSLHLTSLNASITLAAPTGSVYLRFGSLYESVSESATNRVDGASLTLNSLSQGSDDESSVLTYKLCACADTGSLFKVRVKQPHTSCADVRFPVSQNPCPKL